MTKRWANYSLIACLALAGCAPPQPASAEQEKDVPVNTQAPKPEGGEAAAEEVAALLDRIAEQSTHAGKTRTPASPSLPAPPAGPPLSHAEWVSRVLRLIDTLKSPQDTQPAQVSQALGLPLGEEDGAHVVRGPLTDGGAYKAWSNALYRDRPNEWTVGLSQEPREGQTTCLFPLDTLRRHLTARGYNANEGVRQRDGGERALYRSPPMPAGVVFVVSAQIHRAEGAAPCIDEVQVDANPAGDET